MKSPYSSLSFSSPKRRWGSCGIVKVAHCFGDYKVKTLPFIYEGLKEIPERGGCVLKSTVLTTQYLWVSGMEVPVPDMRRISNNITHK